MLVNNNNSQRNNRDTALDLLKIVAAFFVVILHVNGYSVVLHGISNYSTVSRIQYIILEAISYPAIHIFVLVGSYYMIKIDHQQKSIRRIYSQTLTVTIIGLFIAFFLIPSDITLERGLRSIFPFSQRAYWYVSDYIVLLLLSPYLNIIINYTNNKQIVILMIILIFITTILPYISTSDWISSNLLLFVELYIISGYIIRIEDKLKKLHNIYFIIWALATSILAASGIIIYRLSNIIHFLNGKEMFLFKYSSILVHVEGISLFLFFLTKNSKKPISILGQIISKTSLFIYLIHMHPVFKEIYTKYCLLSYIKVNEFTYLIFILITSICILLIGAVIGCCFSQFSSKLELLLRKFMNLFDKNISNNQLIK
jgi:surface polysaccharide O-acyltransferase-like enzyme